MVALEFLRAEWNENWSVFMAGSACVLFCVCMSVGGDVNV